MKSIKIPKLNKTDIRILQNFVSKYAENKGENLNVTNLNDFLDSITAIDISQNLYFLLRSRFESQSIISNLNLSLAQAATMIKCCHYSEKIAKENNDYYAMNLLQKTTSIIDAQLKQLI